MSATVHDVVRATGAKKAGDGYLGRCPAHNDAHASLSIAEGDRVPVVLNCKAGCSFAQIEAALGFEKGQLSREKIVTSTAAPIATYRYRNADGSVFARKQRFVGDGAKTFRWSRPNDPASTEHWISGTEGLMIPLYRLPELIGAPGDELVIIAEGEKDADRLAALGFIVTTTPNGAGSKWRDCDSHHFAGRKVCIIADDDEPGRKKAADTAAGLRDVADAVAVTLPNPNRIKGYDASDFLDSGGTVTELKSVIENAFETRSAPLSSAPEIVTPEDLNERVLRLYQNGDEPGVYPGWEKVRKLFRPRLADLVIIHGAPNAGKSSYLDDMMARISCGDESPSGERCAGWNWLVWSPEQYPPERHTSKLLQKILRKPFGEGPSQRMTRDEIGLGMKLVNEHFTMLDPSFAGCSLDRILEIAHERNQVRPIQAMVLDPYNVIAATSRPKGESEHEFINTLLSTLHAFAKTERICVFVVAHPTKLRREENETEYPIPRPWDISGSAHWYNHADAIICVWRALRDEVRMASGEVEIHVQKIRFQPECGTLGMARLYFDRVTTRFLEEPPLRLTPWEAE